MKKTTFLILILSIITVYSCKNENIADVYNECYSEEVTVNGISIKHYLKGFENELIRSNLLRDSSGKSYQNFFNELMNYDYIVLANKYSFLDSIKGLEYDGVMKCPLKVSFHKDISNSIFGKLGKYMEENNGSHEGFFESQPIDSIFNEETFKYDYIKHKLFNVIKVYDKSNFQGGAILCRTDNCPKRKETL